MKNGFSIIEVMLALCILMICLVALSRMHLVSIQAKVQGERITRATLLGGTMLGKFRNKEITIEELNKGWHHDPGNPNRENNADYYRFWSVRDTSEGKDVRMFVAWTERGRPDVKNFSSQEELESYPCPRIDLRETFLRQR